jgi:MCP family monocarboxylic acid transporter-like MFS transporter 10
MNAGSTIRRLSSGYISDKYGALKVHFAVMLVSNLLLLLPWTFAASIAGAFAFVIILGAFSGAVIGLPPATVANIIHHAPNTDHSRMGHWTGMMYTIAAPFALAGPVIAGHLISEFQMDFLTVQLWSGFCLLLSSMCVGAAIYCMHRKERTKDGRFLRVQSFVSGLFDVEARSLFRNGAMTAVNSRPDTRDISDNKKDGEKE